MSADMIPAVGGAPSGDPDPTTGSNSSGGGAGRGGAETGPGSPLVVVQGPRAATPPRPAPRTSRGNAENSLRNGYAAISHSVSGETAAIGLGFIAAGPAGAIAAGLALPVAVAAVMWRGRRREDAAHTNRTGTTNSPAGSNPGARGRGSGDRGRSGTGAGLGGRHGRAAGAHNGTSGRHNTPAGSRNSTPGSGTKDSSSNSSSPKPKTKDPLGAQLGKLGNGLADKFKNRDRADKAPKNGKDKGAGKGGKDPKSSGDTADENRDDEAVLSGKNNSRKWRLKDRGPQPNSARPWRDKPKKDRRAKGSDDDSSSTTRDGLDPKNAPSGDGATEDRIDLVRNKRSKDRRRRVIAAGKKAEKDAARDATTGDPHKIKLEVIRKEQHKADLQLQRENQLLALTAAAENPRSTPVNYPAITSAPAGTRTAGAAVARQIDVRSSTAYAILAAMAEQLASGLGDADADMADHIVELTGIPNMCKNLATAVREAAAALSKTAPLHPSVIKHLQNAAVAALTAGRMADQIMVVFVQAHREDIIRVLDPRVGEERWNLRNGPGTLDAAKLRAAIASAHSARLALPGGSAPASPGGSGKLVPASDDSTKKLVTLMKGMNRGHMTVCLSEVAGAAGGVDVVADSVTKLYRRMTTSWPTENVVDDTVRATASKVKTISVELRNAVKAAQRAHERELKLNARPRKGAAAERAWDVARNR